MSQPQRTAPHDSFGLTGTLLEGKLRVERVVAEGGFAVVYHATHAILERPIALKVLKPPVDVTERARAAFLDAFVREAKAIVKINHPHIVQVLDFGVARTPAGVEAPWMALEWLAGQTLREELLARRRAGQTGRRPGEVLALARPVLSALAHAHQAGIAHRDVKPANVMLVPTRRGTTELKLLDFGIAKVMGEDEAADPGSGETRTQSLFTAYSLHYAAPEQLGGMRTGPWTDVHAMGLVLTELLTDQPPLGGGDRTEVCSRILAPARPTPGSLGVEVGAWEEVLATALNLRASERFNNAGALLAALEATVARAEGAPPADAASGATSGAPRAAEPAADPQAHTTLRGAVTTTTTARAAAAAHGARARWAVSLLAAVGLAGGAGAVMLRRPEPAARASADTAPTPASHPADAAPAAAQSDAGASTATGSAPPGAGAAPAAAPVDAGASMRASDGASRPHRRHVSPVVHGTERLPVY